ncbi:MAG: hypothetical protein BKP49_06415 [Treponema sp. CETP13]|nr:MAG: hypothetical protein BKP49_06415 [Treponema sp. CETP13]
MSNDISSEIVALLNDTEMPSKPSRTTSKRKLEKQETEEFLKPEAPWATVNLLIKKFQPITKFFSDTHTTEVFYDTSYYKKALNGEGESAQRLHVLLSKYLPCKDVTDRTVYRQQLTTAYWEFIKNLAPKMCNKDTNSIKHMVLRYGIVLPSLSTPEQKEMFSKAIIENTSNEPVYYLDEWFHDICAGHISLSTTDEAPRSKKSTSTDDSARLTQLQAKNAGKLQNAENMFTMQESQRAMLEAELKSRIDILCDHPVIPAYDPHKAAYSESQKKLIPEIIEKLHTLAKNNKEIESTFREFQSAHEIHNSLSQKISNSANVPALSQSDLTTEFQTIRQMAKMTCGRRGNQFPIFTREFFHCIASETGFRENVISILTWIESIDPEAFCRVHKKSKNRIVPFVILLPTYGNLGFCWEPFDRYNRITSRGRIVIPMYPKNLKNAILMAVADLRWQVAKEKASYYWMEEGLTGQYYHYYSSRKLKGEIKNYFIQDYIIWMTKECNGIQKLDKEVRAVFWRNMPFADNIKNELRQRNIVYQELYQKDLNRAASDGY